MTVWDNLRRMAVRGGCLGACLMMAVSFAADSMTAYGAESSVIEQVTVTLKSSYGEPELIMEPEITVSGTGCSLEDFQYMTDYEKWKPGRKVTFSTSSVVPSTYLSELFVGCILSV